MQYSRPQGHDGTSDSSSSSEDNDLKDFIRQEIQSNLMKQSMALGLSQMVQSQIVKEKAEPAKKEITDIQVVHRRDGDMSRINGPGDNKE